MKCENGQIGPFHTVTLLSTPLHSTAVVSNGSTRSGLCEDCMQASVSLVV
jgi:hypothetical protein